MHTTVTRLSNSVLLVGGQIVTKLQECEGIHNKSSRKQPAKSEMDKLGFLGVGDGIVWMRQFHGGLTLGVLTAE